jgi:hypothetical protein
MKLFLSFLLALSVSAFASSVPPTSDSAADSYNLANHLQTETPAHAVVAHALTNTSNAITLDGNNIGAAIPVRFIGSPVSLTGTAGTTVPAVTVIGTTNASQQFILHSARVIVLSSSSVTASPVVQLMSGTTALSGTVALSGSGGYVTPLTVTTPISLLSTGASGVALTLQLVTGGTAAALSAQIDVLGNFLQ